MPAIASGIPVVYLDPASPWLHEIGAVPGGMHLRAGAIARVNLRYDDTPAKLVYDEEYEAVLPALAQIPDGRSFVDVDYDDRDLLADAPVGAVYGFVPAEAKTKTFWNALQKALVDELARTKTTQIFVNTDLKTYARVGETQEAFEARCVEVAGDHADAAMAALRTKYETKLNAARQKVTAAQITANHHQQEYNSNFGLGATVGSVLTGMLGGRRSGSALAADARRERAARAKADASAAKVGAANEAVVMLEQQLNDEIVGIDDAWRAKAANITTKDIPLSKSDITVTDFRLVWIPVA